MNRCDETHTALPQHDHHVQLVILGSMTQGLLYLPSTKCYSLLCMYVTSAISMVTADLFLFLYAVCLVYALCTSVVQVGPPHGNVKKLLHYIAN